jgi:hypothetical protein
MPVEGSLLFAQSSGFFAIPKRSFVASLREVGCMKLVVNGEDVFMNQFVSDVLRDVIHAVVKNLKGVEIDEINKIEVS